MQPGGQARPELIVPQLTAGGVHALTPEAIDAMINSVVMGALHQATSAQNLTTSQSVFLPRQLFTTIPPVSMLSAPIGLTAIAGMKGKQFAPHTMQVPGMGYGREPSGGGQFSYPGIPLLLITDRKIIS